MSRNGVWSSNLKDGLNQQAQVRKYEEKGERMDPRGRREIVVGLIPSRTEELARKKR